MCTAPERLQEPAGVLGGAGRDPALGALQVGPCSWRPAITLSPA